MKIRERYKLNKEAKVGTECTCPSCNTKFIKTNYQQAFCKSKVGTKCKDKYWNLVTPNKRNNTTRISPANARYKSMVIMPSEALKRGFPDVESMLSHVDEVDYGWDGHGCEVSNCEFCGLRAEYCRCE